MREQRIERVWGSVDEGSAAAHGIGCGSPRRAFRLVYGDGLLHDPGEDMMTMRILVLGCLIGAAGGCTSTSTGTIDGPIGYLATSSSAPPRIPTLEMRVELDGTAVRPAIGGGTESATLDRATLDDLRAKILDAQLPMLDPVYLCDCADANVYLVSAQIDGQGYAVSARDLAPHPARLETAIDALQRIIQLPLDWH